MSRVIKKKLNKTEGNLKQRFFILKIVVIASFFLLSWLRPALAIDGIMNGKTITGETDNFLFWLQTYDPATSPYFFDKFFIDKAGNVGIGTTNPTIKLDVNGAFRSTSATISTIGAGIIMADSSGNLFSTSTSVASGIPSPSGISGQTLRSNGTSWIANNLLYNNGTNVGIGTTNPVQKLDVVGSIEIPVTTSSASGVIYKGADRFIHDFALAGTDGHNIFIGKNSGNFTMTGSTSYFGSYNTAIGDYTLNSNTTGTQNTAIGLNALSSNTTGSGSVAIGYEALYSKTANNGTAIGYQSQRSNTTGFNNLSVGVLSLYSNTTGWENTAIGDNSLYSNITGYANVALGFSAGKYETGANAFYVDNQDRTNTAGDKAGALLYGVFDATPANQKLTINAKVGIGTTTPDSSLNIFSAYTTQGFKLSADRDDANGILFQVYDRDSASNGLVFTDYNRLGISTTNPGVTLDVNGAFRSTSATISTIGAGIIMADSSGNLFSTSTSVASGIPSPAGISGQTLRSNGTSWIANNLLYNNGTNVGIGTTAPLSKLSINGGLHVGGDSDAGDNNLLVDGIINGLLVNQGTNSVAGNTAVGALALDGANSGTGMNTAVGNSALTANTSGNSNAAFGQNALYSNTTGYENTANGRQALQNNTSGAGNTASGDMSLFSNITGSSNTAIGSGALFSTTGYNNVALGYYAGEYETGSNAFYVNNIEQANTAADKAYSLLYGTFSGTAGSLTGQKLVINGNVGIGTTNPTVKLDVNGAFRSTSATISTIGAGIIMADSSGNLFSTSTSVASGIPSPAGISGQTLRSNGTNWIANNLLFNNGANIGIGTTNPTYPLQVAGDIGLVSGDIQMSGDNRGIITGYDNMTFATDVDNNSSGDLFVFKGNGSTAYLTINNSGNVGIGTTNPVARLSIQATSTNDILNLFDNTGAEKLTVLNSGNVGIGTTNPGANLDVSGRTVKFSNLYSTYSLHFGGNQDLNWKTIANVTIGTGSYTGAEFEVNILDTNDNYGSAVNSIPMKYFARMRRSGGVQDDGNDADVSGPIADYVRVVKTTTGVYELQVRQIGDWKYMEVTARVVSLNSLGSGGSLVYVDNPINGSTSGTIYNATSGNFNYFTGGYFAGNVGIGTTNPGTVLDVQGLNKGLGVSASQTGNLRISTTDAWGKDIGGSLVLGGKYETGNPAIMAYGTISGRKETAVNSNNAGYLAFETADNSVAPYTLERMRITGTGFVGIGTTAPGVKLDVNGAFRSTSATISTIGAGIIMADSSGNLFSTSTSVASGIPSPAGISGQTLRSNGTSWVANNILYNNGTNVGIGTTAPGQELDLIGDLELETTTSNDTGVIYKGANRFIHNFALAGTNGSNTFVGINAGNFTMTGSTGSQGSYNTGIGSSALVVNTTGYHNTAVGSNALYSNTTGSSNTAIGRAALYNNTIGSGNTASGDSLEANTTGSSNTASGNAALQANTTGGTNTAIGYGALDSNTTGSSNTAIGYGALGDLNITDSGYGNNTAIGINTGLGIVTGLNNTIIGANVGGLAAGLSNNIIIADGSGNRRINVLSNGNVGIGTTNPAKALEILRTGEGAGKTQLRLSTGASLYWDIGRDQGNGNFELIDQGGNNRFTIDQSNGNVGIGTTAPGVKLDVNGAFRSTSATVSTIGSGLIMADSSGNLYSTSTSVATGIPSPAGISGQTLRSNGTSWVANSLLFNDGTNVGIGTTNPVTSLDIATGTLHGIAVGTGAYPSWMGNNGIYTAGAIYAIGGYGMGDWSGLSIGDSTAGIVGTSGGTSGFISFRTNNIGNFKVNGLGQVGIGGSMNVYDSTLTGAAMAIMGGNVGIGTTTPVYKLEVNGTSRLGGQITTSLSGTGSRCLHVDANGVMGVMAGDCGTSTGGDNLGTHIATQNIQLGNYWLSGDGGSEGVFVKSDGNVGIGTNAPIGALHISGASGVGEVIQTTSYITGATANLFFKATGDVADSYKKGAIIFERSATGNGIGALHFALNNTFDTTNATVANARMTILEGGYVGIGTTAPGVKLDVNGALRSSSATISTIGAGLIMADSSGNLFSTSTSVATGIPSPSGISGQTLRSNGTSWVANNILYNNGTNVGIGTTNPGAKLHLSGTTDNAMIIDERDGVSKAMIFFRENGNAVYGGHVGYNALADGLQFNTLENSAEKLGMFIARATGNVGIGTTAPGVRLDVNGAFRSTSATVSTIGSGLIMADSSGNLYSTSTSVATGIPSPAGISGQTLRSNGTNWVANNLLFNDGTNIGIGTTTPSVKLDVTGSTVAGTAIFNVGGVDSSGDVLSILSTGPIASTYAARSSAVLNLGGYGTTPSIWARGGAIFAESYGNVGIGTSSPVYKLEVNGTSRLGGQITTSLSGTGNRCLHVDANGVMGVMAGDCGTSTGGDNLGTHIATQNIQLGNYWLSGDGGSEGVFVKSDGYVGIGTTNPTTKLYVDDGTGTGWSATVASNNPSFGFYDKDNSFYGSMTINSSDMLFQKWSNPTTWVANPVKFSLNAPEGSLVLLSSGNVGINTATPGVILDVNGALRSSSATVSTIGAGIIMADSSGNLYSSSTLAMSGLTLSGDLNMSGHDIKNVNKLTVVTIDPLYNLKGVNYSTYAPSISGGVKEEYVGKVVINSRNPKNKNEYEKIINFSAEPVGSDLWVWRNVVDYNFENVEVIMTPYGKFANAYYLIENNQLIFRSDKPVTLSYRLIGNRFDWRKWPTRAIDQSEPGMKVE